MTYEQLVAQLSDRRKGTLMRITYKTEPSLTAKAIKDNFVVTKIATTTVRWGCSYGNLAAVKAKREEEERLIAAGEIPMKTSQRRPWWAWKAGHENVIKRNLTSDVEYLSLQTIRQGSNTKVYYFVNGREITKTALQELGIVLKSYWTKDSVDTYDVKIKNIISIKAKQQVKNGVV